MPGGVYDDVTERLDEEEHPQPESPAGDVKKIFNDFRRAGNAVAAAGGTGIGLALVRRFAAPRGGRVSAANNPEAGCTIRIELPRR